MSNTVIICQYLTTSLKKYVSVCFNKNTILVSKGFLLWTKVASSFDRYLVEFLELIQSTVPVIKYFEEINHVHCNLLDVILIELFLVALEYTLARYSSLIVESLLALSWSLASKLPVEVTLESGLLEHGLLSIRLFLNDGEDHSSGLWAEFAGLCRVISLRVFQESSCSVKGRNDQDGRRMLWEIVVLNGHFDQEEAHFADELGVFALVPAEIFGQSSFKLVRVSLIEVVVGDEVDFEIEETEEFGLLLQDVFRRDGLVSDLVRDDLGVQREDILVLGSQVHGSDANTVDIAVLKNFASVPEFREVLVEDLNCEEVGANWALEGSTNFDHPVCHFGAVFFRDFVAADRVRHSVWGRHRRWMWATEVQQIVEDLLLLLAHVDVCEVFAIVITRIDLLLQVLAELEQLGLFVVVLRRCHCDSHLRLASGGGRSRFTGLAAVRISLATSSRLLGSSSFLWHTDCWSCWNSLEIEPTALIWRVLVIQVDQLDLSHSVLKLTIYIGEVMVHSQGLLDAVTCSSVLVGRSLILVPDVGNGLKLTGLLLLLILILAHCSEGSPVVVAGGHDETGFGVASGGVCLLPWGCVTSLSCLHLVDGKKANCLGRENLLSSRIIREIFARHQSGRSGLGGCDTNLSGASKEALSFADMCDKATRWSGSCVFFVGHIVFSWAVSVRLFQVWVLICGLIFTQIVIVYLIGFLSPF